MHSTTHEREEQRIERSAILLCVPAHGSAEQQWSHACLWFEIPPQWQPPSQQVQACFSKHVAAHGTARLLTGGSQRNEGRERRRRTGQPLVLSLRDATLLIPAAHCTCASPSLMASLLFVR